MSDDAYLSTAELPPGAKLHSYEVLPIGVDGSSGRQLTCVGKGGFGTVYKVHRGGEVFAAKIGHLALSDYRGAERAHAEARIRREISVLAALDHPNILRIHSFDFWPDTNGRPVLITDWLEGQHLDEWRVNARPSLRTICSVFATIGRALHSAHSQGIFHRDLKCQNVLVVGEGRVVIVDWGIARSRASFTVTRVGAYLGTCTHFSPEYCRFADPNNPAEKFVHTPQSELHAVGYMFHQLLTGQTPWPVPENEAEIFKAILQSKPAVPSSLNRHVPAELDQVVLRLLEKDPADRYATGKELAEQLEELLTKADDTWKEPFEVSGDSAPRPARSSALTPPDAASRPPPPPPVMATANERPARASPKAVSVSSIASVEVVSDEHAVPAAAAAVEPAPTADMLAAAEKLRSAKEGRKPLSLPLVLGGVVSAAVLGLVALVKLSPPAKQPENLLAKVAAAEQAAKAAPSSGAPTPAAPPASTLPPAPAVAAPQPHTARPDELPAQPQLPKASASERASAAEEARAIDKAITARFGRPTVPDVGSPSSAAPAPNDAPKKHAAADVPPWLHSAAESNAADDDEPRGPKAYGVPTGALIRARLQTNLDSRTVADGPATVKLVRPFLVDGRPTFPSGTLLFGQASVSGQRFVIRFTRLRLPDRTEVTFEGLAYDAAEQKPGLAASRTVQVVQAQQPSVASKVAKGAANTLLSAAQAAAPDVATAVATEAGRTAINSDNTTASPASGPALLLDQGVDLDIFVAKAF